MKKLLLVCAACCLLATTAFAGGVDMTVNSCAGVSGASNDVASLDCAGGSTLVLLVTFMPNEAIPDLIAADCIFDLTVGGDVTGPANFWDLQTSNAVALNGTGARPTSGCTGYANNFGVANSGFAVGGAVRGPGSVRLSSTAYRPSTVAALVNSKLFASQITLDLSTSVESTLGTATGCTLPVSIAVEQCLPGGTGATLLTGPSLASQVVALNGAGQPTATARHSWGALKSLYR